MLAALPVFFFAGAFFAHRFFYEVPVLMYHHVDRVPEHAGTFVSPESFERQMEFLKVHHYRVISLSQLIHEMKEGRKIPPRTVSITFDDGFLDNFRHAFPTLKKMDFPATLFMITSNIGREDWLGEEDLRILDESNITIGSHTVHHAFLPELPSDQIKKELVDSKETLRHILGHDVSLFSYPAGGLTPEIETMVSDAGYEGAVTTNYGEAKADLYAIRRIKIGESAGNLFNFWIKVSGYYRLGKRHVFAAE